MALHYLFMNLNPIVCSIGFRFNSLFPVSMQAFFLRDHPPDTQTNDVGTEIVSSHKTDVGRKRDVSSLSQNCCYL